MSRLSTVAPTDPADDIAVLREMAKEFEDYILKDEVYRTVIVTTWRGEESVQSSGGDILARLHKLAAQKSELSGRLRDEYEELKTSLRTDMDQMRTPLLGLLKRESKARLNSLRWYMDECAEDKRLCRIQYPFEIRNRQRVAEIWKEFGEERPEDIAKEIATVDRRLKGLASRSEFVWDESLARIFPKEEYWYLYMLPRG